MFTKLPVNLAKTHLLLINKDYLVFTSYRQLCNFERTGHRLSRLQVLKGRTQCIVCLQPVTASGWKHRFFVGKNLSE